MVKNMLLVSSADAEKEKNNKGILFSSKSSPLDTVISSLSLSSTSESTEAVVSLFSYNQCSLLSSLSSVATAIMHLKISSPKKYLIHFSSSVT